MWLWQRRRRHDTSIEAHASRLRAQANLDATRAETPKYEALGARLRELRERNNFAAAIERSFRGGRA